jgi:hypothetical protein
MESKDGTAGEGRHTRRREIDCTEVPERESGAPGAHRRGRRVAEAPADEGRSIAGESADEQDPTRCSGR